MKFCKSYVFVPGKLKMLLAATLLLSAGPSFAVTEIIPHATARYEHDSNLLLVPENAPRVDSSGQARLEDSYQDYSGGIDINYLWRDNRAYLITNYHRYVYQHFTSLDHDGITGSTGIDWTATRKIKGNVEYTYDRHQASFIDFNVLDPNLSYIETSQQAQLSGTYDMSSRWRGELKTTYITAKLPDAGTQSYDMYATRAVAGVNYVGATRLTTGVSIDRTNGHYRDQPQNSYTATVYQYNASYKINARLSANGTIGYDKRAQLNNDNSATVGSFTLTHQVTVKTGYFLQFKRAFENYNALQGSQLSTSGIVGVNFQATQKISLSANYERAKVHVEPSASVPNSARNDELKASNFSLKYAALRWLTISPYYRYQRRDSETASLNFKTSNYGISFEARLAP